MRKLHKIVMHLHNSINIKVLKQWKILLGVLFLSSLSLGQNLPPKSDYSQLEDRLNELSKSVAELIQDQKNTITSNDSLKKELQYYKIKEDYYSDALGDQSNRFALIVAGILSLMAFVSYSGFKYELKRMKKDTEKQLSVQTSEFEKYKTSIKILDSSVQKSMSNTFVVLGNIFWNTEQWVSALQYHLYAARDQAYSALSDIEIYKGEKDEKDNFKTTIANLKEAKRSLNKITINDDLKKETKNKLDIMIDSLDSLKDVDIVEVKDLVAEIRTRLNSYTR